MGVEHFQLRFRDVAQVPFPLGNAFVVRQADHPAQHVWTDVLKDQHPAGLLLPLDHGVEASISAVTSKESTSFSDC